jgi:predicted ATPase/signal transduction histidine kinase
MESVGMNSGIDLAMTIPGYLLTEELYSGSKTTVYRAVREEDQQSVVIKFLTREYPTFHELLQFRNQYAIAKNLDIPGIVRFYSLEPYRNSYALVMEDFGGISLREYVQQQFLSLPEILALAIQLTNILYNLYQQKIIHKDIKPANILINPESKQVKLIDFSIASLLPRENQNIITPNILEGTLAYLSPEQTGRMNRGIDYRSDFYSLGVTLFELLNGELPFISHDPMELVHCHIAKQPDQFKNEEIPQVIAEIVMKLMAKNAEDRYQSALGLKYDLEKCLVELKETGTVEYFEIAQRDVCDRFLIPEKLYGRESQVEQLLAAFERVAEGNTEMILVAGFSGIGKTAVVNEIHKPIVRQRGYFIKGKFDQFNRNIPLSAFVQAFRDLMGQLFTESDEKLQQWKNKILTALGENGQVIIDVIPELAKIIGEQPPAPELSGIAAQNRFNLLFQNFIQVFKTKEHPLVIFLDDLQWADSASLKLIQLLMGDPEHGHLLLIGAYRDHEVSLVHPLITTLDEIKKIGAKFQTITLLKLSELQINTLVADTLNCAADLAWSLSELVYQKTQGNPFFTTQFLKALHQDGLIIFNFAEGCWQGDITQINLQALTDDVVEFMAVQLRKLPKSTQGILKLAACIGNSFDLATLAIIAEQPEIETAACLWNALQECLVLPQNEVYKFFQESEIEQSKNHQIEYNQLPSYKFIHDRVQQAAYSLIPNEKKQSTHLKIGQLILQHIPESAREEKIFDIVNQLNMAGELIIEETARKQLAQLNLIAGCKAKKSTAYSAAVSYLNRGLNLLTANSWQADYDLTLNLHLENIEAQYLNSNFPIANDLAEIVLQQTDNLLHRVRSHELQIQICIAQRKPHQAIDIGLQALEILGYPMLAELGKDGLMVELPDLETEVSEMTDPYQLAAMRVIKTILSAILAAKPQLLPLAILSQVQLCIKYGRSALATGAYAWYGTILCAAGNIEAGYAAGKLSLQLLKEFDAKNLKCSTYNMFYTFIQHWKEHLRHSFTPLIEGVQNGIETGDYEYAGYCATNYCIYQFLSGENLEVVEKNQYQYQELLLKLKLEHSFCNPEIWHQLSLNLLGKVTEPSRLIGQSFDENFMLSKLEAENNRLAIFFTYLIKTILLYLLEPEAPAQAVVNILKSTEDSQAVMGTEFFVAHNFYYSLAVLANYFHVEKAEQEQYLAQVAINQKTMQHWANHAPMNYQHKYDLITAETARILGNHLQAIENYDRAISGAKENGYLSEEALANELAAKFYLNWDKQKVAQAYMQEAYYCYARWGAKAKTNDLEKRYPQLLQPILQQQRLNLNPLESIAFSGTFSATITSSTDTSSIPHTLDFISILKAAQAISSSIEIDELVTNLTRILLENSGAKKAALILTHENTLQVKAITSINYSSNSPAQIQTTLVSLPLEACEYIPINIIHYVKNTQQAVVINNLQTNIPALIGEYMLEHEPKSVFCTPIINQGHLVGILYLENKLTSGVFTKERLQVIKLLAAQTAISLENAQLYQQSQQALQDLQQAQLQIVQSEKMSALGNLVAGVAHEMNNPLGFIAVSLKQAKPTIADIVEHLKLYQENFPHANEQILDHAEEIDLNFSLEDIPKVIDAMVIACDRLKNISTSLRIFSRADKDYKVPFNIHQGIDSTILILKHRLKANEQNPAIEVITEYSDLPEIECFPGQLNQVFMNLLANAIDALEESVVNPQIRIKTFREAHQVKITIADNGIGINAEVKQRIFDHLFTTKGVNKGTGLGLAIAQQIIVEKHGGKIEVNSTLGQGTEFVLTLPLK